MTTVMVTADTACLQPFKAVTYYLLVEPSEENTVAILIFQMRKLWHIEVK